MMAALHTIEVPGEGTDLNPDRQLAADAGAMTARVFVDDVKRGMLSHTQAFDRLTAGMDLMRPAFSGGGGSSPFFDSLAADFARGFIIELARQSR